MTNAELIRTLSRKTRYQHQGDSTIYVEITAKENEAVISALSATIPRETAKIKPTIADSLKSLWAIDDMGSWHFKKWYEIADCPSTYLYWFVMPEAPTEGTL